MTIISKDNPFPGIRSFESSEDYLFFGREKQITEVTNTLLKTRFLAIIGSSGSGKSSLVKAGLIPTLFKHKYENPDFDWDLTLLRPGDDPIGNLAKALYNFYDRNEINKSENIQVSEMESVLSEKKSGLIEITRKQSGTDTKNRLIIIDQFEEIFRFKNIDGSTDANKDAHQFVNLILKTLEITDSNIYIVLTMRSDFLGDCTEFAGLPEAINNGSYLIPRMSPKEKEDAIIMPVKAFDYKITDRLVDRLLLDLGEDPDHLPIMQHALMRTWDYWKINKVKDQAIDIEHYEAIGGITGALSIHAEEIYNELTTDKNKNISEKLFKALTDLGSDNRGIRRPTSLKDICTLSNATTEEVVEIIDYFRAPGRTFLMPPPSESLKPETMIDISHESIMRVWDRLREWVEEETKSAQLYLRLSKAAELYHEGKTGLWVNPDLQIALQWKKKDNPNMTWAARYDPAFDRAINFLEYSDKQLKLEITKKENKHRRDLKRARRFAVLLGIASLISLLFLVGSLKLMSEAETSEKEALKKEKIANTRKNEADVQKKEAIIQKKISEQQQYIAEQQKLITEEQKQIAIDQKGIAEFQTLEAFRQKFEATKAKEIAIVARDDAEKQRQAAVEQKRIADQNRKKAETAQEKAERLRMIAISKSMAIKASELSRTKEGDLAALLALQAFKFNNENNGSVNDPDIFNALLDVTNERQVIREHKDAVRKAVFVNSNNRIISCSDDGTIKMIELGSEANPDIFNTGKYGVEGFRSLAISKSGDKIAAGNLSGDIIICKISDPKASPTVLKQHTSIVNDLDFDQTGNSLISVGSDGKLILWDLTKQNENFRILQESAGIISSVCFNNSGKFAACGKNDGEAIILNIEDNGTPIRLKPGNKPIKSIMYSNDSETLAIGLDNGTIFLYKTNDFNSSPVELIGHISGITSLCFSEDNNYLASGSYDKTIRIWMYKQPDINPILLEGHDSWIYGIDYSSDGHKIASCSADKTIHVITVDLSLLAEKICGTINANMSKDDWNKYIGDDIDYRSTCKEFN